MTIPSLPQPYSPDDDTTPWPTTSPVDISPLTSAFGTGLMDYSLAYVCTAIAGVSILGLEPFAFMNSWATNLVDQANTAITNAATAITNTATIATGVTSNITGATSTSSSSGVGPAVSVLNGTVQIASQAPNVQIFNASGTWTMPAGAKSVDVTLIGAGGGGSRGGSSGGDGGGSPGGGGGGQSTYTFLASALTSTVTITCGTAGTGATTDSTNGGAGTASSFGSYISAGGGGGGPTGTLQTSTYLSPGTQGFGSNNNYSVFGGCGAWCGVAGQSGGVGPFSAAGAGGSSSGGNGGAGSSPSPSSLIGPGSGGGGGGGAATSTVNGGNGGAGGFPGGGGGGGGAYYTFATNGNGGNGAGGQVVVVTHFS
jgi:hypothetical protein